MNKMKTIVIFTNSIDGTSDSLISLLEEISIEYFRWNIDLWQNYDISYSEKNCYISDPVGRIVDLLNPGVFLLWRKPYTNLMDFKGLSLNQDDIHQAQSQMGQWMRAVVAMMTSQRRIRLIEPYADRRIPKLFQLYEAKRFFDVPHSVFSCSSKVEEFGPKIIAKFLGDPSLNDKKILFTKYVEEKNLFRPFPWFVQEALIGGSDVTCVHILGKNYFYECNFSRNEKNVDWRTEINSECQSSWHKLNYSGLAELNNSVNSFMKELKLHYGRLDFIRKEDGIKFLECNTNGQFGWLDDHTDLILHREFLNAVLNQESQIP